MSEELELSEREIDIIRLVATGASNKEIAHELVISPNTVKVHLRNIFAKLDVMSRTEATMVAISRGWVESPKSDTADQTDIPVGDNEMLAPDSAIKSDRISRNSIAVVLSIVLLVVSVILVLNYSRLQRLAEERNAQIDTLSANRWQILESTPVDLFAMASLKYEQSLFLIGGISAGKVSGDIHIFDTTTTSWSKGQQKPQPVSHIQAVSMGEKIYVPGGTSTDGNILSAMEVYDPRDDKWELKAELPMALTRYGLAAYEGRIYLFGGWDGNDYLADVLVYDPNSDTWERFDQLPKPVADMGVSVVSGVIHLFGGFGQEGATDAHYTFFPQRKLDGDSPWEIARAMPQRRYGMGLNVLADMVYFAGGLDENGELLPAIQYLPLSDDWLEIEQPPQPIGLLPAVLPLDSRLFILGGEINGTGQTSFQVYQAVYTILVPVIQK